MAISRLLLLGAVLLAGCDFISVVRDGATRAAAERPEGWESLDDEGSALRLYYQFVDAQRQVRFVETLEDVPQALRASVGFVKMAMPPPLSPGDAARARSAQLKRGGRLRVAKSSAGGPAVVLYSAEWCGACRKAKRYLGKKGIDYEERDIDDPRWTEELLRKTGRRSIPVIDVGGRILTGFSASSYDALLRRA